MKSKLKILIPVVSLVVIIIIVAIVVILRKKPDYSDYLDNTRDKTLADYYQYTESEGEAVYEYVGSNNADSLIFNAMNDNGYNKIDIIDEYYDYGELTYTYVIVFDDSVLYYVSVSEDGTAYMSQGDYNWYMEIH